MTLIVVVVMAKAQSGCADGRGGLRKLSPEAVCADAAYANGPNAAALEERDVRLVSPPRRIGVREGQFTTEDFIYDDTRDVYVCPGDHTLTYIGTERTKKQRRRYRAPRSVCTVCALRSCCTTSDRKTLYISPHYDALKRLRADAQTESFRAIYRARFPVSEGVFAEAKQWHGLRRAWRRGLSNMLMQSLLIAAVLNFKRLMASIGGFWASLTGAILRSMDQSAIRFVSVEDTTAFATSK